MGILSTGSKKEQIKKASAGHLSAFKKIIVGLTATNKQVEAEEKYATKRIEDLKVDLKDYEQIKKENQGVIDGLNALLGIKN